MSNAYLMEIRLDGVRKSPFLDAYVASFDVECKAIGFCESFDYFCDTADDFILKSHIRFVLELKKRIEDFGVNKENSVMAQTFKRKTKKLLRGFLTSKEVFCGNPEHIVNELKKIQINIVLTDDDLK